MCGLYVSAKEMPNFSAALENQGGVIKERVWGVFESFLPQTC
jgi:hypothetical protein